jgi:hypothetical protein
MHATPAAHLIRLNGGVVSNGHTGGLMRPDDDGAGPPPSTRALVGVLAAEIDARRPSPLLPRRRCFHGGPGPGTTVNGDTSDGLIISDGPATGSRK